jgi:hypothetical protein
VGFVNGNSARSPKLLLLLFRSFDSNCITPGTEFMHRLGLAFTKWIEFKMETDPFWKVRRKRRPILCVCRVSFAVQSLSMSFMSVHMPACTANPPSLPLPN